MGGKMSILELNQVSYTYKNRFHRVEAVKSISTVFDQGKVYAIIGKSGSGKSTLLSVMAGLDLPTDGVVIFEGKSLADINLDQYRKNDISVIYQAFHLFPLLNAIENVMYPIELQKIRSKEARKRANELLHKMQLEEHCFKHYPSMLSGGEQQRVAIARALASNPKVLLADEPTGNLDSENSNMIVDILINLAHEENYCIIIITHDMEISNRADVILHLKDGVLCVS
jgi:putative ABC transport system ATP-binding protein